jgi:hypothetical protein
MALPLILVFYECVCRAEIFAGQIQKAGKSPDRPALFANLMNPGAIVNRNREGRAVRGLDTIE